VKLGPSAYLTVELLISSGCPSLHHLIAFKAARMPNAAMLTGLREAARYQDVSMPARQINGSPAG